jgi:hypothetical protein
MFVSECRPTLAFGSDSTVFPLFYAPSKKVKKLFFTIFFSVIFHFFSQFTLKNITAHRFVGDVMIILENYEKMAPMTVEIAILELR